MLTLQNLNITRGGGAISNQALVFGTRAVTVPCRLGIAGEPDEIELSNDIVASLSMMMSWRRGEYLLLHNEAACVASWNSYTPLALLCLTSDCSLPFRRRVLDCAVRVYHAHAQQEAARPRRSGK
jgi:hypothetical protein